MFWDNSLIARCELIFWAKRAAHAYWSAPFVLLHTPNQSRFLLSRFARASE
jgi:hypothetical protein